MVQTGKAQRPPCRVWHLSQLWCLRKLQHYRHPIDWPASWPNTDHYIDSHFFSSQLNNTVTNMLKMAFGIQGLATVFVTSSWIRPWLNLGHSSFCHSVALLVSVNQTLTCRTWWVRLSAHGTHGDVGSECWLGTEKESNHSLIEFNCSSFEQGRPVLQVLWRLGHCFLRYRLHETCARSHTLTHTNVASVKC